MKEIALVIPGYDTVVNNPTAAHGFFDLGSSVSQFLQLGLYITGFLMIIWMAWGIFQYIFSGGNKEGIAQARKRIIFAIVGFIIVVLAYTLQSYIHDIIKPQENSVQPVNIQ
jgi:hypothetical protein